MSGAMLGAAFFKMRRLGQQKAVAAEDAAEVAACDVVPWEEPWNSDDPAVDEDAGVAEGGAALLSKDAASPDDETLAWRYAKFGGDRLETPLYTANSHLVLREEPKVEAELCRVLGAAFKRVTGYEKGSDMRNSAALMQAVTEATGYKVEAVSSVLNRRLYNMHCQFGLSYGIDVTHTAYHGTSKESANAIVLTGFKGSACRRAKIGWGTYAATDVFNAASYAHPEPTDGLQEVLVVEVRKGPTGLGMADMVCS